tara:strand:- start:14 stop:1789 length:1776 start_codon:yes stop_codon:yes gene_type:complete
MNLIKPPPSLTISQWADKFRVLSTESSSEAGKFETTRAIFQKEIMDSINEPTINEVVVLSCSQVGKTEMLLNAIGYYIAYAPAPILVVQPTLEMARAWSQDRLAPMIRDSNILKSKVAEVKSKDSANTVLHKIFDGGHITACGANSPASLASRPIKIVLCDEIDRYPPTAGSEGDPVMLAKRRSTTFWDSKLVMTSTPTVKGNSQIEEAYERSDKRLFYVPCHKCKKKQVLKWSQVQWDKDKPQTVRYTCEKCETKWTDIQRIISISKGKWQATEKFNGRAGFRINGLYSVWVTMEEAVREFLMAKKQPETLRVFVNTYLGETWEDEGERIDDLGLYDRREDYTVPNEVVLLTAGVDIQDDRLEVEIVGWGLEEETWSIDYFIVYGDPTSPNIWQELELILTKTFEKPDKTKLKIISTCIDSGHHTNMVYQFCKPRYARRVFAIKGIGGEGKAIVSRPNKNNIARITLFPIGVDTAKELIYSRLRIKKFGAGYCHFPKKYSEEYFRQLTAEKIVTKYRRGFKKREWVLMRPRNEALDCRVYALSAFTLLNADLNTIVQRQKKVQTNNPHKVNPNRLKHYQKNSNFAKSWND